MKNFIILITTIILSIVSVFAQTLNIPQPSPAQTITQSFATSKIEISYSRPSVRGRTIFGDLVPYDKVWRTGANNATTIYFGEDVVINNVKIPKGKYGLLTIPGKEEWTIIISKDTTVTSPNDYKQENDAVRVKAKPVTLSKNIETFTIDIANIKNNSADIEIKWANTEVSFNVSTDIDSKIMKQIDEVMNADKRPYYQAASYYYENDKDMKKALEWVNKAIEQRPEAFWIYHLKAKIQYKLKDYNGAIATAEISKEKAKKAEYDEYVKMNDKLIEEIKAKPDFKPAKKK
ncbi:MAG: DUF2911 domain-containing protein [Bacteroidia bacterium]